MSAEELPTCKWCGRYTERHMSAYYFGFEPTGVEEIDNILCSVAAAGKAYHHTESWCEPVSHRGDQSYVDLIQAAANAAAAKLRQEAP